ncbi:MAG: HEAT repeat domain-containing protein [Planctomycetota bacterium]|nr:HEAT repeat domain-containing protein [Planctomycetota bacterium]
MNLRHLIPLIVLCTVPAAAAEAAVSAPSRAFVEDVPDKRPEVEKLCEDMKTHVAKGGAADQDAVAVVDKLLQEYKNSGPKDRAAIVTALSKNFEAKRRENEAGVRDNRIFRASAVAMGQMGSDATKAITKWIGAKDHRKDIPVQSDLIHALGKTKDKTALPDLIGLLEHKDAPLVGAAADALAEFADSDLDTRKKGFEGMLKVLMSAKGAKDSNVNDGIARDRYDTIASPIITSLTRLSKHDERDPDKWQNWWNKNKAKNWDEEK